MQDTSKYLKSLGALGIGLLVLVVIFAVAILMGGSFKQNVCTQEGGTYSSGACSITSSAAYNATRDLVAQIISIVGWVGLIVIAAIGAILIAMARSFWTGNKGDGM